MPRVANNQSGGFSQCWTQDDLVDRRAHTDAFLLALSRRASSCDLHRQGAPHYWASDPIDEPGSYSGFLARRLVRFLQEKL